MNMAKAIALSPGNKAKNVNEKGHTIVVQERYNSVAETWLHVWDAFGDTVLETDLPLPHPVQLLSAYGVDPDAGYWIAIGG